MADFTWPWAVIRSWHFVRQVQEEGRTVWTLCGRTVDLAEVQYSDPPTEGKSCETCFRVAARMAASAEEV